MTETLKYLAHYPVDLQNQVRARIENDTLRDFILSRYPELHSYSNDKLLRNYVLEIKNQYLKQSSPLSQIKYDDKIHVINNALGQHTFISRVQGSKLKSKNEIKIATVFKKTPEAFLNMIVVHELAHIREKEHNKAFYKLCQYMQPDYHQLEFDMRLYLTQLELLGEVYR